MLDFFQITTRKLLPLVCVTSTYKNSPSRTNFGNYFIFEIGFIEIENF